MNNLYNVLAYTISNIFRWKDGSLDRIIEMKMKLAQIRRVGELKSIFGFCIYFYVYAKKIQ